MWAASNYGGSVQGLVQYNNFAGTVGAIRGYCATMTNASAAPIDNLAAALLVLNGPACVDNSYADFVAQAGSTVVNKNAGGLGLRQWLWQTCAEFSYYQTCEDRNACPLSLYMTEDSNTQQCADLFGAAFNATSVTSRVVDTNAQLGGFQIQTSRVLFINGDVGPCRARRRVPRRGRFTRASRVLPRPPHPHPRAPSTQIRGTGSPSTTTSPTARRCPLCGFLADRTAATWASPATTTPSLRRRACASTTFSRSEWPRRGASVGRATRRRCVAVCATTSTNHATMPSQSSAPSDAPSDANDGARRGP